MSKLEPAASVAEPNNKDPVLDASWGASPEALYTALQSTPAGLTEEGANRARRRYGANTAAQRGRHSDLKLLWGQIASPMMLLLLGAGVLSLAVGSMIDAWIILGIVGLSVLIGFWQEHAAAHAVEVLLARVAVNTVVVRGGADREVPVLEVVPGDVVRLRAGNLVPADAILLEANALHVDEAALTGESMPTEKRPGPVDAQTPLAGRLGSLWFGTHVVSGTATALVVRTGGRTAFGEIARRLNTQPPTSDFQRGVSAFGGLLVRVTSVLVFGIFTANMYFQRPFLDSFLFAVALAVGLVPEMLPAIVSITLSAGAHRMAKRGVIVKRLAAIENFGSMNVLCADKTGTLTEGTVKLEGTLDTLGGTSARVLRYAAANATFESGFLNPVDAALRAAAPDLAGLTRLDEVPYDFIRKRLSVLVDQADGAPLLITKGALANILAVCTDALLPDGRRVPLSEVRAGIEQRFEALSEQGQRVLGLATRSLPDHRGTSAPDEAGMTFEGFLTFADPPRADAGTVVNGLRELGIRLQIITGDNRAVASRVARAVGIEAPVVLSGPDLHLLSDAALVARVGSVDVFAEVEPNQKERIILAQQKAGNVVGFLGDGINDATALHAADVGISVDSAADVAKEAAEIVLLQHDLSVVIDGVREGRATFANTLKYIYITTSANFGNMLSMAGATLFLPFLPMLPRQILLNNFLSDFPAMTIATDHVDAAQLARPQRWDVKRIRNFMFVFGAISSLFDFMTFGVLWWLGETEEVFRTGWFLVSLLTELVILLVMRTHRPFLQSRPSTPLLVATLATAGLTVALVVLPIGKPFGLVPLPPMLLAACLAVTAGYTAASEIAKRYFFHRFS